jgi:predicted DCC family thiol-disulfide oxidoreductase YuxK
MHNEENIMTQYEEPIELIYDGKCPICVPCVEAYALKDDTGALKKIDARENNEALLDEMEAAGMDINKGLVVRYQGKLHYAAEAMALLAKLGTNKGLLNYINATFFRYKPLATLGYPLLKAVRRLSFIVLNIPMITRGQHDE